MLNLLRVLFRRCFFVFSAVLVVEGVFVLVQFLLLAGHKAAVLVVELLVVLVVAD